MPSYRIHRLREAVRQQFRFAPHVTGAAVVKPRDYEPDASIEAPSPYAAFFASRETGAALEVGDVLETESGELRIFKYVGFEEARWFVPEPKPEEVLVQSSSI
jgi:hypothetical protein